MRTVHPTSSWSFVSLAIVFACLAALTICSRAAAQNSAQAPAVGLGPQVHTALGGFILGYDVQKNGTEGVLAESVGLAGGKDNAAVETFDQKTGKILKIVTQQDNTFNDYVTLGIFGKGIGLVEQERSTGGFVNKRVYGQMDPLNGNKFTGMWTPPFTKDDLIISMPSSQGSATTPVLYFDNGGSFNSFILSTNVAANTFTQPLMISDPDFAFNVSPVMAYDSNTNTAVLGGSLGCYGCTTQIGEVNLNNGKFSEFGGLGFGYINGIAVDSDDGIACTVTEDDFSVEFYDLATQTGTIEILQGATNQAQSGGDVEYDPVHKLFLIGQEFSSIAPTGSSILVYDTKGNFVEAINGLSLPASPAYMALHPSARAGYVIVTPDLTSLQQFTY
jgi:hypothetical protein